MFIILVIISAWLQLTSTLWTTADLNLSAPCDRISYITSSNVQTQTPIGVCWGTHAQSHMFVCTADSTYEWRTYQTPDCKGGFTTLDLVSTLESAGYTEIGGHCCTGNPCAYMVEKTYNTTSCNDNKTTYQSYPYYIGKSPYFSCSGLLSGPLWHYESCYETRTVDTNESAWIAEKIMLEGTCTSHRYLVSYNLYSGCVTSDGSQVEIECGTAMLTC
eukprot:197958_1